MTRNEPQIQKNTHPVNFKLYATDRWDAAANGIPAVFGLHQNNGVHNVLSLLYNDGG